MRKVLLLVVVIAVAACFQSNAAGTDYDLHEYGIGGSDILTTEDDNLTIINSGEVPHTLVVTNQAGEVVAAHDMVQPGEVVDFNVDLEAGTYEFSCRIVVQTETGELVDHYEQGMNLTVEVTG